MTRSTVVVPPFSEGTNRLTEEGVGRRALPSLPGHSPLVTPMSLTADAVLHCSPSCGRVWVGSDLRVASEWTDHLAWVRRRNNDALTTPRPAPRPAPRPWRWSDHHRRGRVPVGGRRRTGVRHARRSQVFRAREGSVHVVRRRGVMRLIETSNSIRLLCCLNAPSSCMEVQMALDLCTHSRSEVGVDHHSSHLTDLPTPGTPHKALLAEAPRPARCAKSGLARQKVVRRRTTHVPYGTQEVMP
jgi:hypothetical protein